MTISNEHKRIKYEEDEELFCRICGKNFKRPLVHARLVHKISAKEYKELFELDG